MDTHRTHSPEETRALGRRLATRLEPGAVLALHGDLGAGKTCLVQGLADGLGIETVVNSPTYTLINEYRGRLSLFHIDLYRISGADEAYGLGLDEYFEAGGVVAIEWAERATELLPADTLEVTIRHGAAEEEREFIFSQPLPGAPV